MPKIIGSYELGKTLGKGSYSTVKRAYHIATRNEVAIKILTLGTRCDMEDIEREIAILKLLKHPNIIQLIDVIHGEEGDEERGERETNTGEPNYKAFSSKKVYLVFELVNGGDLFDYTIARGRLAEREARRIMREVVSAVAYCHSNMVVHRDIKLENLLMDKDGHARIADFGMSGIMQTGLKMNSFCGSPIYMSPEIVQGLGYGPGVDIWSLGVVLYAIVVGCTPWKIDKSKAGMVEDLDAVLRGEFTYPPDVKLSPECKELISLMLVPETAKRATIEQIMYHPWLTEGYGQPVTVPMNVVPVVEVNELILKHMMAMGYSEAQTRKAISDDIPSPARMVYQHMVHQLEENGDNYHPSIPATPRRHSRHSSASPRLMTSPRRNSGTSPRKLLDGRTRAISDASVRRRSMEVVSTSHLSTVIPVVVPVSPRSALAASWRQAQMSTISEESPVGISTETPGNHVPPTRNPLSLSLNLSSTLISHHSPLGFSSPNISPPPPQLQQHSHLYQSINQISTSAPVSPITSPRNGSLLWGSEEQLVSVRGAFNVATTTLKPRRALIAEIARALDSFHLSCSLSRSIFSCKQFQDREDREDGQKQERELDSSGSSSEEEMEGRECRLKFDVEVCRVAGMEMILGIRFQRVQGDKNEYQDMCKKLMAVMKL